MGAMARLSDAHDFDALWDLVHNPPVNATRGHAGQRAPGTQMPM